MEGIFQKKNCIKMKAEEIKEIKQKIIDTLEGITEIYAEDGEDFQEYCYTNGKKVKAGTIIGYENNEGELTLLKGIYFN